MNYNKFINKYLNKKDYIKKVIAANVQLIKSGRAIKKKYKKSTVKKRKKYGLPTSFIDLYGSTAYDGHAYRMLKQIRVRQTGKKITVYFGDKKSAEIFKIHRKKYSLNLLKI